MLEVYYDFAADDFLRVIRRTKHLAIERAVALGQSDVRQPPGDPRLERRMRVSAGDDRPPARPPWEFWGLLANPRRVAVVPQIVARREIDVGSVPGNFG